MHDQRDTALETDVRGGAEAIDQRAVGELLVWLVGATVLGAGLRLHDLEGASFWVDELNTIRVCADLESVHRSKVCGYLPTTIGLWLHGVRPSSISADYPEAWRELGVNEYSARIASCLLGVVSTPLLGRPAGGC